MDSGKTFDTLERELRIRNYSKNTISSYVYYNNELLRFCEKNPREVNTEDIKNFLDYLAIERSASTVSVAYGALQFYYKQIWKRSFFVNMKRPKKQKFLPTVLSKQEVMKMIALTKNPKHHTMISLLYGAGLRVSELLHLKMRDIDFERNVIHIIQSKGAKDRYTVLPQSIKDVLIHQRELKKGNDFLFTNGRGGRLTTTTIQKVVVQASQRAGIDKRVTPHTLPLICNTPPGIRNRHSLHSRASWACKD